jgi:hypothetical protein
VRRSAVLAPEGVETKRLVVLEYIGVETTVTTAPINAAKKVEATTNTQFFRRMCQ